jgi:hypothetical protein
MWRFGIVLLFYALFLVPSVLAQDTPTPTPTPVYLVTPVPTPVSTEYVTLEHYYALQLEEQRQQGLYLRYGVILTVLLLVLGLFRLSTR